MKNRILFLLVGNIVYDARVFKEITTLKNYDYEVALVQTVKVSHDELMKFDFPIYIIEKKSHKSLLDGFFNVIQFARKLRPIIKNFKPDFIHCNDVNTLFYAPLFINKIKVIYDSHELAVECTTGMMKHIVTFVERIFLKKLHAIIIPQYDRLKYFSFKYPITKGKLYLIENFPLNTSISVDDFFRKRLNVRYKDTDKIIVYTGIISEERCIYELVQSVKNIPEVVLVIIGFSHSSSYFSKIENYIKINKLNHKVFLCAPMPAEEILLASKYADIGVCFYNDENLNSYFCASNKLYEYLNFGTLVLTNNTVGAARVVKEQNGILINEINLFSIEKALNELTKFPKPMRENYYWDNQEKVLLNIYK